MRFRHLYLLISIVLMLVVLPIIESAGYQRFFLTLPIALVLLTALNAISHRRWPIIVGLALAVPWLVLSGLRSVGGQLAFQGVSVVLATAFLLFATIWLLLHIMRSREITLEQLYGAMSVYLLTGLVWSGVYIII